jgi:Recombination endonuclease VII
MLDITSAVEYDSRQDTLIWKKNKKIVYQEPSVGGARILWNNTYYQAGRVVWLLNTGEWPPQKRLVYKDGDKYNTKFSNLAISTPVKRVRKVNRKTRHGLTEEQYNDLLAYQDNKCAICLRPPKEKRRMAVDHCHSSDRVRGILCQYCNLALGQMQDDTTRLRRAIDYLEANK